ncbi:MAG: hypothetical protein MUD12_07715 [Spirochaetes bacterium]|jgi:hypothetical protein|nr:hypothetical protein [Spirochaetota bacterium]
MKTGPGTILCQPDPGKGCSACCGLFNLKDISRENLVKFLSGDRQGLFDVDGPIDWAPGKEMVRDITSHVCPHQGFTGIARPGCRSHPLSCGADLRDSSLFGKKICDSFFCPAHYILGDAEKKILISSLDDWYAYSIAVIDPNSFKWLLMTAAEHGKRGKALSGFLEGALLVHSRFLNSSGLPVFFYAVSEYTLGYKSLSLKKNGPDDVETSEIKSLL